MISNGKWHWVFDELCAAIDRKASGKRSFVPEFASARSDCADLR